MREQLVVQSLMNDSKRLDDRTQTCGTHLFIGSGVEQRLSIAERKQEYKVMEKSNGE